MTTAVDFDLLRQLTNACPAKGPMFVEPTERVWPKTGIRGVQWRVIENHPELEPWPVAEVDPDAFLADESQEPIARYYAALSPVVMEEVLNRIDRQRELLGSVLDAIPEGYSVLREKIQAELGS